MLTSRPGVTQMALLQDTAFSEKPVEFVGRTAISPMELESMGHEWSIREHVRNWGEWRLIKLQIRFGMSPPGGRGRTIRRIIESRANSRVGRKRFSHSMIGCAADRGHNLR